MSRRSLAVLALIAALAAQTARAQESTDAKTADVLAKGRAAVGPISPEQALKACREQDKQGEIVVCAKGDDKQFRVQSSAELDPNSRANTRTGVPRAPKLDGEACDIKKITCIGLGKKRDPIYFIDLAAIPETPKGSDAEKVANGEMPDR